MASFRFFRGQADDSFVGYTMFWLLVVIPIGCVILIGRCIYHHVDIHMRGEKSACKNGDVAACIAVGENYVERSETSKYSDDAVAIEYLDRACTLGSMKACDRLGWVATNTDDDTFSNAKARKAWDVACKGKLAKACTEEGDLLEVQLHDLATAVTYYDLGCQANELESCFLQGYALYFGGTGIKSDKVRGLELLNRACTGGFQKACKALKK